MPTCLYFAYGSNMMTARLRLRCPSATPVGIAFADDHRLTFWKKGRDGSGKGHLAASPRTSQPGVLFTLAADDLARLDEIEGVGRGYRRADDFTVRRAATNEITRTAAYLATDIDETLQPYDWYLALILAGAREHGFDAEIVRQLGATPWREDPDSQRQTRHEAIGLITTAGTTIPGVLGR